MSLFSSKSGFTLIETLLALACIPMLLVLVYGMIKVMSHTKPQEISQLEVLELQLSQSLIRASNIVYEEDSISYSYNNQLFTIMKDGERLVRTPGYEFLLTNLKEFQISNHSIKVCDEVSCFEI